VRLVNVIADVRGVAGEIMGELAVRYVAWVTIPQILTTNPPP
jgi:hypothetical protein